MFKVSVLRGTKVKPELVKVAEVMADRCVVKEPESRGLLSNPSAGIYFYNDDKKFFGGVESSLVAFLPGTDWIIETV